MRWLVDPRRAAPDAEPEGDGLEEEDRDVLQALGATIKEVVQGELRLG